MQHYDSLKKFRELFGLSAKQQVLSYCHSMILTQDDLVCMILSASAFGYRYEHGSARFHCEDALLKEKDIRQFDQRRVNGEEAEAVRRLDGKTRAMFASRKVLNGHLFIGASDWHLIYFTYDDLDDYNNHWQEGPHVHFVNHLWPELRLEHLNEILFESRSHGIEGSAHIRYQSLTPYLDSSGKCYFVSDGDWGSDCSRIFGL